MMKKMERAKGRARHSEFVKQRYFDHDCDSRRISTEARNGAVGSVAP